jgi:hypothetical protein
MVYGSYVTKRKTRTFPARFAPAAYDIVYNSNGSVYQQNLVASYLLSEANEEIVYTNRPKNMRSVANFCKHIRNSKSIPGPTRVGGVATDLNPDGTFDFDVGTHVSASSNTAWNNVTAAWGDLSIPTGDVAQGLVNDAFAKFKPDLTSIQVPNFLLELENIPKMWRLWKTQLSVLRNLAEARLNWSYGWKPLIGDLSTIRNTILSVYQQIKEWNDKGPQIIKRKLDYPISNDTLTGDFVYPSGNHKTYWSASQEQTLAAYLVFKTEKIPGLDTWETVLRAYLDALGFELNPKIIWDAIPFSFVLDWFFDVGGWIERHKIDTLELPIVLVDSYLQYKAERRVEAYWQRDPTSGTYLPPPRSVTSVQVQRLFQRLPIFPDYSAATAAGWKIPGLNQLINAISLGTVLRR